MLVTDKTRSERLAICNACEHNKVGICTKCGCIIRLKTQMKTSSCPLQKWLEEFSSE